MAISQATSIVLVFAFVMYIVYCTTTSHSPFNEVIHKDEASDRDAEEDHYKPKLTMTEALAGLAIAIALVTLLLVFVIEQIEYVVESGVPDHFLGLILLPLVGKGRRAADCHLSCLGRCDQRCDVPLHRTIHSDRPTERTTHRPYRLGRGQTR